VLIRLFLVLLLAVSLGTSSPWNLPDAGAATIVLLDEEVAPAEPEEAVLLAEPAWISDQPEPWSNQVTTPRSPMSPELGSVFRPPRTIRS
jgi:hypothetical protein